MFCPRAFETAGDWGRAQEPHGELFFFFVVADTLLMVSRARILFPIQM